MGGGGGTHGDLYLGLCYLSYMLMIFFRSLNFMKTILFADNTTTYA